jgi:hypothetical protein
MTSKVLLLMRIIEAGERRLWKAGKVCRQI